METNKNTFETITTARLQIERLHIKYVQEIFKEFTDEVTKFLRASTPKNIQEEIDRVERSKVKFEQGTDMNLVVTDDQGNFIGCCGIMHLDTNTPELGLRIKKSERGKGYGKEMIIALINRLESHKKFDYIIYRAHVENIGSRKIAQAIGAILQLGDDGKENVFLEEKFDKSSSFPSVEYRIYKK